MHIGRRNKLSITLDPITRKDIIPFLDCTLQERHTPIADTQAKGMRDAEGGQSVEGKKWGDGKVDVILDPTTAPYWLALALGSIDSTTPKNHVITQNPENEPLVGTIARERNVGEMIKFLDSVVDTLELSFADDVAKLSMNILSKYPIPADESPGEEGEEEELTYYTFRNASVKIGDLEIPEAMTPIKVRELTLNIENGSELIYAPGDNDVDRIASKSIRITGNFKLLFEDPTQLTAFSQVGKQGMLITFDGEDSDEITIEIPQFRVDNWSEEASIDDLAQEGIDFVAEYNAVAEKTISAKVINGVDKYIT